MIIAIHSQEGDHEASELKVHYTVDVANVHYIY